MSGPCWLPLLEELEEEVQTRDVPLFSVARRVSEARGSASVVDLPPDFSTLELCRALLSSGRAWAVDLLPGGRFAPWPGTVEAQVARIAREWSNLDHALAVGDIVWFVGSRATCIED